MEQPRREGEGGRLTTTPHAPQLFRFVARSGQNQPGPLDQGHAGPSGHMHVPATQEEAGLPASATHQERQAPQCELSVCGSTQVPKHSSWPRTQVLLSCRGRRAARAGVSDATRRGGRGTRERGRGSRREWGGWAELTDRQCRERGEEEHGGSVVQRTRRRAHSYEHMTSTGVNLAASGAQFTRAIGASALSTDPSVPGATHQGAHTSLSRCESTS
jgi:hypothetical protein